VRFDLRRVWQTRRIMSLARGFTGFFTLLRMNCSGSSSYFVGTPLAYLQL
jgi:hypothetical protein